MADIQAVSAFPGYEPEIPVPGEPMEVPGVGSPFRAAGPIPVPGAVPTAAIPVPGVPVTGAIPVPGAVPVAPELAAPELQAPPTNGYAAPDPYTPPPVPFTPPPPGGAGAVPFTPPVANADPFAQAAASASSMEREDKLYRPGSRQDLASRGMYATPDGVNPSADVLRAAGVKHIPGAYTTDQLHGVSANIGVYGLLPKLATTSVLLAGFVLLVPAFVDGTRVLAGLGPKGEDVALLLGPSEGPAVDAVAAAGWPIAMFLFAVLHLLAARAVRNGLHQSLTGARALGLAWIAAGAAWQAAQAPIAWSGAAAAVGVVFIVLSVLKPVRDWCSRVMV